MALDMLAQAYEAEDSQTMTATTLFINDDKSDGSDHEDTVIENIDDTVIQNNDSYIDQIIKSNHTHSESQTFTSPSNAFLPYTSSHNIIPRTTTPNYKQQPSQDFLLIIENFQKQLQEKNKENETLKNKLKEMKNNYDNIIHTNNALKQQINKLKKNDNISEQSKQSEEYEPIIKW
eukprot:313020_1